MVTLPQHAPGQLVCLGRALGKAGLQGRIKQHVDEPQHYQNPAEKAAIEYGWQLEVVWAETTNPAHRADLLREYHAVHGRLPGFERPDNGEFVKGPKHLFKESGAVGNPGWSAWHPMEKATVPDIPTAHGVYCIRAVPPT